MSVGAAITDEDLGYEASLLQQQGLPHRLQRRGAIGV
jgi:hypothetical protein